MPAQPPVIVLPGITATVLDDYYPLEPEEIWSAIVHKEYERIALHPDDTRYEAMEPGRVLPRSLFDLVYSDLVDALRHDLTKKKDRPTPVFGFGYDWRQDCGRTAVQLDILIDEVLARTALLPHYKSDKPLGGHFKTGHLWTGQNRPLKARRPRRFRFTSSGPLRASYRFAPEAG